MSASWSNIQNKFIFSKLSGLDYIHSSIFMAYFFGVSHMQYELGPGHTFCWGFQKSSRQSCVLAFQCSIESVPFHCREILQHLRQLNKQSFQFDSKKVLWLGQALDMHCRNSILFFSNFFMSFTKILPRCQKLEKYPISFLRMTSTSAWRLSHTLTASLWSSAHLRILHNNQR